METFTPYIFPEMTVYFEYTPEERRTMWDPGCPEEFDFTEIEINDKVVGQDLTDHLIETFEGDWKDELRKRRLEDAFPF